MAVGHHGEHMRPVERLYFNGTHQFAPTLILISLDGFRNDYLDRNVTPHLSQFGKLFISDSCHHHHHRNH